MLGGVVEEDDAARLDALGDAAAYLRGIQPLPVKAVDIPLHRRHSEGVYRVNDAVVILAVGAAEERRARPRQSLYLIRAGVYFRCDFVGGELRHVRMGVRVVHDLHACVCKLFHTLWIFIHPLAHEEEGRLYVIAVQNFDKLLRVLVAPGRVEAERNVFPVALDAVNREAPFRGGGPDDRRRVHHGENQRDGQHKSYAA